MNILIWIIGEDRRKMIELQRSINNSGCMRAICLISIEAFKELIEKLKNEDGSDDLMVGSPSLVMADHDMALKNDFEVSRIMKEDTSLAGVPIFVTVDKKSEELCEACYERGAAAVVHNRLSKSELTRIENAAWQHENTRLYEQKLQKQASELLKAKEIFLLNQQLESRNMLLQKTFGRYFSDEVVNLILNKGENVSLGGEKRKVTIMMTDLRNFTSLSENMDSDRVTSLLNFYFDKMVDIISKYGGTVIEFLGDGMLTVFGAPLTVENPIDNAVAAAIIMQNSMASLNEYFVEHNFPVLEMGIGLHYGEVFIGNIGSEKMMRYNVIGSPVNLCSRIESCSVGGQIIASKEIVNNVVNPICTKNEVEIMAKGLLGPIKIFEVTGIEGTYDCHLENVNDDGDDFTPVEKEIELHLYPINGKLIDSDYVTAHLLGISNKRISVRIDADNSKNIDMYTNVKITSEVNKKEMYGGFYSKVIGHSNDTWILHYTDSGNVISDFIKWVTSVQGMSE